MTKLSEETKTYMFLAIHALSKKELAELVYSFVIYEIKTHMDGEDGIQNAINYVGYVKKSILDKVKENS